MNPVNLDGEKTKKLFAELYGAGDDVFAANKKRYEEVIDGFGRKFGAAENLRLFSSPGRSEIGGNHTDHNHGKVLAAGIQLDCIGAVAANADNKIRVCDLSYHEDYEVDIAAIPEKPPTPEKGSAALIRGICAGFKKSGLKTGGFSACFSSSVLPGSGVSSSASFEMMIAKILSNLYNGGGVSIEKMAAMGQYAENVFWAKGSGLMDQTASAAGGLIAIEFNEPANPVLEKIPFDFAAQKSKLILVNTGSSHTDLAAVYTTIPVEMKKVAKLFGKETLRGVTMEQLAEHMSDIRAKCGDRAALRALHFVGDNARVDEEAATLKAGDYSRFLELVAASGDSSFKRLQNIYIPTVECREQNVAVCLALTEIFIEQRQLNRGKRRAACRVHGGGFGGTMQLFLPEEETAAYEDWMKKALGVKADDPNPVFVMAIRPYGTIEIETE